MTLKGASLLSRLVNRSAQLWFAVHVARIRGERRIDEAIRRLAVVLVQNATQAQEERHTKIQYISTIVKQACIHN